MVTKKLIDVYDKHDNSFDDLRFLFACLVLFVHSYVLLYGQVGAGTDPFTIVTHFQLSPGTLAVYGFFVLSGFFMIQSLESNRSLWQYTKNRVLRIVPAFWLSLFLSSFVVVPLIFESSPILSTKAGSSLYFFMHSAVFQAFGSVWTISGAYLDNPIESINGSIWTLKYEVLLYVLLPLIYTFVYRKSKLILAFMVVLLVLSLGYILAEFMIFNIFNSDEYSKLLLLTSYFFYGVLLYLYRELVIVSKRFILISSFIFIISMFFGNLKLITLLFYPYIIIAIGSVIRTRFFSKSGDYSYGMYIYAFPVQQTLVHFFKSDLNAYTLLVFSFLLTLMLSIVSWHLYEKKILTLKYKKDRSSKTK